jgi:protein-S-isoprenylcysteine O-methyltransferase Ste14
MILFAPALFAVGGAIYTWCVWDFAAFGRGTPAPIDAPKRLVVRGLYRYTRNPMYVGVLTVLLGWAFLFQATTVLVYAICVGIFFHLFVVLYEERRLARQFGAEYHNYCRSVGRWLPHFR